MSKTCGTDAQKGAVRMRSTEFGGKTFFELKIKCVEHLRGYSSIGKSAHFASERFRDQNAVLPKFFSLLAGCKPGIF